MNHLLKYYYRLTLLFCFLDSFFCEVSTAQQRSSVTIVSWNLQNFGASKSAETVSIIADIIYRYDIIAIQEVVGKRGGVSAVNRLVDSLNQITNTSDWRAVVSKITSGNTYQKERYAFIWNRKKVKLSGRAWLDSSYSNEIEREPFFGTFIHGRDTFTLANFHAIPKKKQPQQEIKYFKFYPGIYPKLNLIFLGDFNTPQKDNVFNPLKKLGYLPVLKSQKTTLKMKCVKGECLASEYDNFFYNSRKFKPVSSGFIPFYRRFPDMVSARKISDHVPIIFTFEMP